jgi:hypothetical protein
LKEYKRKIRGLMSNSGSICFNGYSYNDNFIYGLNRKNNIEEIEEIETVEKQLTKITCSHCGVINNKDYGVCDRCGAPLIEEIKQQTNFTEVRGGIGNKLLYKCSSSLGDELATLLALRGLKIRAGLDFKDINIQINNKRKEIENENYKTTIQ